MYVSFGCVIFICILLRNPESKQGDFHNIFHFTFTNSIQYIRLRCDGDDDDDGDDRMWLYYNNEMK